MHWFKPILSAGESLVDRFLCVLGAVAFSQAPEFMQQYLQRLGGHLAEARRQLAQFEELARQAGKNLHELAAQYAANADPAVVNVSRLITDAELRVNKLASAEAALRDASVWERPFVFLRDLDWEIVRGASNVFKPAVPTTLEGLLYGVIGVVVVLAVYHGMISPLLRRIWTKREAKPEARVA